MDVKRSVLILGTSLLKIFGALLVSFIVLSLFCLVYNYSPAGVADVTNSTTWKYPSNSFASNMYEGFAFIRFDKNGYNNCKVKQSIDVLFLGSSHMEGRQVPTDQNACSLLETVYLPDFSAYNLGVSGHDFCECLTHVKNAYNAYRPRKYVVIETCVAEFPIETIDSVVDGKFHSKELSFYSKLLKKVPLWTSFYTQLKGWKKSEQRNNRESDSSKQIDPEYEEKLSRMLEDACNVECRIIVLFQPLEYLNSDGSIAFKVREDYLNIFERCCDKAGIIFVNMSPEFERSYYSEHILPHGFSNTVVGSGHLNRHGHQMIAKRLAEVIVEDLNQ